jgi:DNA-binding NarL/FixJ family response regulator
VEASSGTDTDKTPTTPALDDERIRVVIADDHPFYRQGLAKLLTDLGIDVVGEAATGLAALESVERLSPDVLVLDLNMPTVSGVEVCRELTARDPPTRVLMVSVSAQEVDVHEAILAGAGGYVLKDEPAEEVLAGIRAVVRGESLVSPRIASMLLRGVRDADDPEVDLRRVPLSEREQEVLALVADGRTNREIGDALFIDPSTVRNHISHILEKLQVDNRVQAAVSAVRQRMV